MEVKQSIIGGLIIITLVLIWRAMKLLWFKQKKIESCLRKQGIKGNPYKPLIGDVMEFVKLTNESMLKPINLYRLFCSPYYPNSCVGKMCCAWLGPIPWLIISDPEKIKEILTNHQDFRRSDTLLDKLLMVGLFSKEGDTPAFHMEKLKNVCTTMYESCSMMMNSLERIGASFKDGSMEVDIWPFLENLWGDFISRAAFGTSDEQGKRIFELQNEYVMMLTLLSLAPLDSIPGWRYLPTMNNRRVKEIIKELEETYRRMIESREAEMEGGGTKDDFLGALMESKMRESKESGLTIKEVVEECRQFYLAGSETTSSLLVWTLILLSKYPIWQERARTEVLHEFGKDGRPKLNGLNRLRVVNVIIHEVLRLYPPAYLLMRKVYDDIRLKELLIPAETEIIILLCVIHQDSSLWGEDSKEFNPQRFAKGVFEATKGQLIYFPFSDGPRICIGKNFALLGAKLGLTMILQRYSFHLSPNYVHAPYAIITTRPQHGAHLILSQLHS